MNYFLHFNYLFDQDLSQKFHFFHTYEVYIRVVVIGLLDVNDIRQMCGLIDVTLDISVSLT